MKQILALATVAMMACSSGQASKVAVKEAETGQAESPDTAVAKVLPLPLQEDYIIGRIYDVVEEMPQFPGGSKAMMEFIKNNISYPKELEETCVQGRVIVTFVVERDGSLSNITVVKSLDPLLDREAVRVVKLMPKWQPGKMNGHTVRVKYCIPVTFKLE